MFIGHYGGASWTQGQESATPPAEGMTWRSLDTLAYWSVGFAGPRAGWAVGPGGRITRIDLAP